MKHGICIAVLACALGAKAAGAADRVYILPYPLVIDGQPYGEVPARVDAKGNLQVRPADLVDLLKDRIEADRLTALRDNQTFTAPDAIADDAFHLHFNPAKQQLEGQLNASATQVQSLSINGGEGRARPNAAYAPQADASAYVNFFPYVQYVHKGSDGKGFQPFSMNVDGAVRLFGQSGVALEGAGSYAESSTSARWQRNDVRAVYDRPDDLLRVQAGDLRYDAAGFQDTPKIGGLSVSSNFGLQPGVVFRPTGQHGIQVDQASDADIYVNGVKVRTLSLAAGRYDLNDFPYTVGNNNVEVVLRDRSGREQRINFSGYQDFSLLKTGTQQYSYNVGAASTASGSGYTYHTDQPIFTAYHRYAFTDAWTAGVNLQAGKQATSGGGEALFGTELGLFGLNVSGSDSKAHGHGSAATLRYALDTSSGSGEQPFDSVNVRAQATHYAGNFVGVDDAISNIRNTYSLSTGTNLSRRLSVYGGLQRDDIRAGSTVGVFSGSGARAGHRDGVSLGLSYSITDRLSTSLQGRYLRDTSSVTSAAHDKTVFLSLSWRPWAGETVTSSYASDQHQSSLNYYHAGTGAVGSASYGVGAVQTGNTSTGANGYYDYTGNRFTLTAASDSAVRSSAAAGSDTWRSTLRGGTALVFADGHVALSRPIYDSFAMIVPDVGIADKPLSVNPDHAGTARAVGDMFGPPVLPDLYSYYSARVAIESDALPVGYDVGKGSYDVLPAYHSGYALPFGSRNAVTVIGTPDPTAATLLPLTTARIESLDDPNFKPITTFTGSTGRFSASGMKPGNYRLRFLTSPEYTSEFTVPDDGQYLFRLNHFVIRKME